MEDNEEPKDPCFGCVMNSQKPLPAVLYEVLPCGLCLALIGGFLDAYTYILHGHVFANAQTGNMVLFAIYLAEGSNDCVKYLIQIVAFFLGIIIVDIVQSFLKPTAHFKFMTVISICEFVTLLIIGFLPLTFPSEWLCAIVAFVNAIQAAAFRRIDNNICCTTMCTGNLRSLGDNLVKSVRERDIKYVKDSGTYFLLILFFMLGGIISHALINKFGYRSVWFCNAVLLVNFSIILFQKIIQMREKKKSTEHKQVNEVETDEKINTNNHPKSEDSEHLEEI